MVFSTRCLFVFDHLLPSFLGVNFLQYLPPSIRLMMLSTQPKQRASEPKGGAPVRSTDCPATRGGAGSWQHQHAIVPLWLPQRHLVREATS